MNTVSLIYTNVLYRSDIFSDCNIIYIFLCDMKIELLKCILNIITDSTERCEEGSYSLMYTHSHTRNCQR
jgi:hypothetical protein